MALIGILDKGIALVHGTAGHTAILGENGLHIRLLHHSCVEVSNEDPRVDGLGVILVGYIACLDLQGHDGNLEVGRGEREYKHNYETGCPGWAQGLLMAHILTKLDCSLLAFLHSSTPIAPSLPVSVILLCYQELPHTGC